MLSFNLTSIVNLLGFLAFMLLMYRLLYKPYFDMTDKRKQEVEKNLNEAEKLRLETQKGKEDLDRRLSEIDDERRKIIEKANEQAQNIVKAAQEEANEQRKNILDKAEKEAEEIKERASRELQTKIVSLAVAISSMILKEQIDKRKNEEIIRRAIDSLKDKGEL